MSEAKSIVIIDPSAEATPGLAGRLRMQGYQVSVFIDPGEGACAALADPPAAVIADLWMPKISGVQLCRLLNAEPATEHVPVLLRGPDSSRNRFWAERAGASYVVKGRMGDLVRSLDEQIARSRVSSGFFTTFTGEDIRDRIAAHLDAALFESVLAAEVRALGTCGAFDRLFDLFSQFLSRVTTYRWVAVSTDAPARMGLHTNSLSRDAAEREARGALGAGPETALVLVEDDDACPAPVAGPPIVRTIELGGIRLGRIAVSLPAATTVADETLTDIVAREIAGPIRMATLVEESQRLATIDALTGLMNRRAALGMLGSEVSRSDRYGHPLCFVLLDIDHFKAINDSRGHRTGDVVLTALGRHLQAVIRNTDTAARWGGEEFVVALPSTDLEGGRILAERLRASIEELGIDDGDGGEVRITASIGLAQFTPGESIDALVDRADVAMYAAKAGGRNWVVAAEPRPTGGSPAVRAPDAAPIALPSRRDGLSDSAA